MRDPDLVVRAQQAATALESAWCRWRNMHGLGNDPVPPVSSYVGYSLEAPWGEARIVFGICAEEAEQLAVLLERHDCVGPVHASVTAKSVGQVQSGSRNGAPDQPGAAGFVHVPAPSPASAGQQPRPAGAAGQPRPGSLPAPRYRDRAAATALTGPATPGQAVAGTPIALAASRAVEASMASRRKAANGSSAAQAERAGEPAAAGTAGTAGTDRGSDADDHPAPDRAAHPPADRAADRTADRPAERAADRAQGQDRAGQQARPRAGDPAAPADAGEQAVAAGMAPVPAFQPFPWSVGPQPSGRGPAGEAGPGGEREPAGDNSRAGERDAAGEREGQAAQDSPGIVAFRPRPDPASYLASLQRDEPFPADRDDQPAAAAEGDLARSGRTPRSPSLSRFRRPGAGPDRAAATADDQAETQAIARPQAGERPADNRDRVSSAAATADAAAWAASELPGQAAVTDTAV
jgi:hypothetical protein